jgi:DNA (cytosine-5)-methyltransferase 1
MGYHRAGFDVVGIDINPQPNYPFEFHQADALKVLAAGYLPYEETAPFTFDVIHASPPCQAYTQLAAVNAKLGREQKHEKLIAAVRGHLQELGLPYVIENVVGSELVDPVRVCGTSFGLPLRRHRLFESNLDLVGTTCAHHLFTEPKYWTGWRPNGEHRLSTVVQVYGNAGGKHEWPAAMQIDWMTNDEIAEAVPPAYTERFGVQILARLKAQQEMAA